MHQTGFMVTFRQIFWLLQRALRIAKLPNQCSSETRKGLNIALRSLVDPSCIVNASDRIYAHIPADILVFTARIAKLRNQWSSETSKGFNLPLAPGAAMDFAEAR
ncbi:hypothetical protein CBR_g49723 [Chara braunii]|uniref:Uncharacterized protein n=1 Tax=Chara braunii TaxID=69332 RepID=A0A388M5T6_CHABU|nr:hypothetical protein CBR_g49723 [Chara braunii]|eukprot:GBG89875.1 hypothetical protein CBR_g49723 [Chara braunii]